MIKQQFQSIQKDEFNSIYDLEEISKVLNEISSTFENSIALDIGCGIPTKLYELKCGFNFKKLIGIDKAKEFSQLKNENFLYTKCNSIKDCYSRIIDHLMNFPHLQLTPEVKKQMLVDFNRDFKYYWGEQIELFDFQKLPILNSIFMINVLHFLPFDKAEIVIRKSLKKLSNSGIFIIRVNHSSHFSMTNQNIVDEVSTDIYRNKNTEELTYLYSENRFKNIIKVCEEFNVYPIITPYKLLNEENDKGESLIYFGRKQ